MSEENKSKRKFSALSIVILVIIVVLIFAVLGLAIVMFILSIKQEPSVSDSSIGNYLTIFSILFTLLAIILPFASYLINKDEVKKINKDVNRQLEEVRKEYNELSAQVKGSLNILDSRYSELSTQVDERLDILNIRHVELLESIINRSSIKYSPKYDEYMSANVLYVNALRLFNDGTYDVSLKNIENTIDILGTLDLTKMQKEYGEHDVPLLVYKAFDLYRRISGRIRFSKGNLIDSLKKFLANLEDNPECPVYRIIVYLYVKSRLDKVEKTFIISESLDDLDYLIKKIENYSVEFYALKARKNYISAYYYGDKSKYKDAIDFATEGYNRVEKPITSFGDNEVNKLIKTDCLLTIAKVFEKTSFSIKGKEKEKLLSDAKTIIEELIKIKPTAKFYLELSEIFKKLDKKDDSDYAAQYGFKMSPLDPLLAAQCAFVYLKAYLNEPNNAGYIDKAEECIETAYWIYCREKEKYNHNINVKFSYIASLYALISAVNLIRATDAEFNLKADVVEIGTTSRDEEITINLQENVATFEAINQGIENSIKDNINNVPNYKRAFIIYTLLYGYCDENNKKNVYDKLIHYIGEFRKNGESFKFNQDDLFFEFSEAIVNLNLAQKDDDVVKEVKKIVTPIYENI